MKPHYIVEPEYDLAIGCRCCSCWERNGEWSVYDENGDNKGKVFKSLELAKAFLLEQGVTEAEIDGVETALDV